MGPGSRSKGVPPAHVYHRRRATARARDPEGSRPRRGRLPRFVSGIVATVLRAARIGATRRVVLRGSRSGSVASRVSAARKLETAECPIPGETYGDAPPRSAPKYVRGCFNQENYLALWRLVDAATMPATGLPIFRVPHRCHSWRHGGPCARYAAARDFSRIREALSGADPESIVYFVLTLDPSRWRGEGTRWELFRALGDLQSKMIKRLNRLAELEGGDPIGSRWVCVIEQHRNGWPHLNLVCVSSWLASRVRAVHATHARVGLPAAEQTLVGGDVARHVRGAGFGPRSTADVASSVGAVAGYLVKLAGLVESQAKTLGPEARAVAEVAKISQAPSAAPRGFRRLRSGIRFLPPRRKGSGKWTGALASWDGRLLRRGTVGAARSATLIDLEGGRVYRADRPPLLIGHAAPVRRYAIKRSESAPPLAGTVRPPLPAASLDLRVALLRFAGSSSADRRSQLSTRERGPPDPDRRPATSLGP